MDKENKTYSMSIRVSEDELAKLKQAARLEAYASYREIGELLNISEDAAKKRGQRLVKKLQKLYEER